MGLSVVQKVFAVEELAKHGIAEVFMAAPLEGKTYMIDKWRWQHDIATRQ